MMKNISILMILLFTWRATLLSQTPIISMTSANDTGSTFTFVLRSWQPPASNNVEVDFGDGVKVNNNISASVEGTTITGILGASKIVTIYGSQIAELKCPNQNLTEIKFYDYSSFFVLDCSDNQLTEIDLSKMSNLQNLDCSNNKIAALDLSQITYLHSLLCDYNQLSEIKLPGITTYLYSISCSYNLLTSLDVSLTNLVQLVCDQNKFTHLDLANNSNLERLYCNFNQLTHLDFSNNSNLEGLSCSYNQLTSLKTNNDTNLSITCDYNMLNFATLPTGTFKYYWCAPQAAVSLAKSITTGDTLNLSDQFRVNDDTTTFKWISQNGQLLEGKDYTNTNGKFVFLKPLAGSAYCEMSNEAFPHFSGTKVLSTTALKIDTAYQLSVSETAINIGYSANSSGSFTISSNTLWTITSSAAWLTANPTSGSNDGAITLTAEANTAASSRSATITVSGAGINSQTVTITQAGKATTRIDELNNGGPMVYPNPVSNLLFIKNSAGSKLKIYDAHGRKVMVKEMYNHIENINVSALPEGLYIVRIGNQQIKLVKK